MRTSCVTSVAEAVRRIGHGATVGIGGSISSGHPMAVLRGLLHRDIGDLVVVEPTAGLDLDLLIACGRVRKVASAYVGCEGIASSGPAFRAAVERGSLEIDDMDEAHCAQGLRAAAQGLPFLPWRGGVGTSLPELNPMLVDFADPVRGERLIAVPAIGLDVAVVAAEAADEYGNVRFGDAPFMDPLLASAAEHVIVQVEAIVDNTEIRRQPGRTHYWQSTSVVLAAAGTHPYAGPSMVRDEHHLREYADAARALRAGDRAPLETYLRRYVERCPTHDAYLSEIGRERVEELRMQAA